MRGEGKMSQHGKARKEEAVMSTVFLDTLVGGGVSVAYIGSSAPRPSVYVYHTKDGREIGQQASTEPIGEE